MSRSILFSILIFTFASAAFSSSEKDRYLLTKSRMPLVYETGENFKPSDKKIVIGLPLTFETLCVVDSLRKIFKDITIIPQSSGENSSTQPGVFKYLQRWGIRYFTDATEQSRLEALSNNPDIVIDCSFMLGEVAVKHGLLNEETLLIEDTKTGENRILELEKECEITFPYLILDNSIYKRAYENARGIGYSVVASLMSMGFFLPNYKLTVVGFGYVGSGLAHYARTLGADVTVVDIDPYKRKIAAKNGYTVRSLQVALESTDILITATGKEQVVTKKDLQDLNRRIILANAGGEEEWNRKNMFGGSSGEQIHERIFRFKVGSAEVWEVGGGNSINLVSQISITEYLDITFSYLVFILGEVDSINFQNGKNDLSMFNSENFDASVEGRYGPPVTLFD